LIFATKEPHAKEKKKQKKTNYKKRTNNCPFHSRLVHSFSHRHIYFFL
jgi:hypothetical protein